MYADFEFYQTVYMGELDEATATRALDQASRHVDALTFNRIKGVGWDTLTPFQQEIIQRSCCMMADFEVANADMLDMMLSSYSLNGASMTFNGESAAATVINGVVVRRDTLEYLAQSGLCTRSLAWG